MILDPNPEEPGDMVSVGPFFLPPGYMSREVDLAVCNLLKVHGEAEDTLHSPAVILAANQEYRSYFTDWGKKYTSDPRPFSSTPKPRRVQVRQQQ